MASPHRWHCYSMLDVILVHAYPLDGRMWAPQVAATPVDLRLHVLDLPGFGGSTSAQQPRTVDLLAEAIHEVARPFTRFALCGLSMGGYVSLAYWRRFGHEGRLAGLVLADTRAEADTPEGKSGRNDTLQLLREQGLAALAERLIPRLLAPTAAPEVVKRVRDLIQSQRVETVMAATEALRDRPDSTAQLPGMNVPVLAVGGSLDALTPPAVMQGMVARLPRARWHCIDGAGHLANLERPVAFNEAVFGFLRSL